MTQTIQCFFFKTTDLHLGDTEDCGDLTLGLFLKEAELDQET